MEVRDEDERESYVKGDRECELLRLCLSLEHIQDVCDDGCHDSGETEDEFERARGEARLGEEDRIWLRETDAAEEWIRQREQGGRGEERDRGEGVVGTGEARERARCR